MPLQIMNGMEWLVLAGYMFALYCVTFQAVPQELIEMAERYEAMRARREQQLAQRQ